MPWIRLRPTFEIPLEETRDQAIEKLGAEWNRTGPGETFLMYGEYGELHLPPNEHRLWSPHLSFYVMGQDSKSLLHGRFAPRPNVWTLLWIIYLLMAFSAFFGLMLGYSQWMLGESMWGLAIAIAGLVVVVSIYVVAHLGQQFSSDQMQSLRERLQRTLASAGVRCRVD